jgi:hypothetical protein
LKLQGIAFVDFCPIQVDEFQTLWADTIHVVEELTERVVKAASVIQVYDTRIFGAQHILLYDSRHSQIE